MTPIDSGPVPGTAAADPGLPPSPPADVDSRAVEVARAVHEAMSALGDRAEPAALAAHARAAGGPDVTAEQAAAVRDEIRKQMAPPPAGEAAVVGDQQAG